MYLTRLPPPRFHRRRLVLSFGSRAYTTRAHDAAHPPTGISAQRSLRGRKYANRSFRIIFAAKISDVPFSAFDSDVLSPGFYPFRRRGADTVNKAIPPHTDNTACKIINSWGRDAEQ